MAVCLALPPPEQHRRCRMALQTWRHRRTGKTITVEAGTRHAERIAAHRAWEPANQPQPQDAPEDPQPAVTEPVHECQVCGKQTKTAGGLASHERTHDDGGGGW